MKVIRQKTKPQHLNLCLGHTALVLITDYIVYIYICIYLCSDIAKAGTDSQSDGKKIEAHKEFSFEAIPSSFIATKKYAMLSCQHKNCKNFLEI